MYNVHIARKCLGVQRACSLAYGGGVAALICAKITQPVVAVSLTTEFACKTGCRKRKTGCSDCYNPFLAEREGFEPPDP